MERNKPGDKVVKRPHVHDGIEEYEHPLPLWWTALLWATIVWSGGYLAYYHLLGGPSLVDEYNVAAEAMAVKRASLVVAPGGNLDERLADPAMVAAGAPLYQQNCAPCHGDAGQGTVGPNLTDPYWIHGGSAADIVKIIADGYVEKGMIGWEAILGAEKVEQLSAFVISLKGTNPPNAKEPQGELVE